jgi:superfamily II DNA or RNA helicase
MSLSPTSSNDTPGSGPHASVWVASLSPGGHVRLHPEPAPDAGSDDPASAELVAAFARGAGFGLLHLGATEAFAGWDPSVAYFAELGRSFVGGACAALNPLLPSALVVPEADRARLERLAHAAPPMRGAELVTPAVLEGLWRAMGAALEALAAEHGGLQGWLGSIRSPWNVAGRVCLHVAENTRDPEYPFAFLATYARQGADAAGLRYLPLSRALQEYAGAGNKQKLLALILPLQRAAQASPLLAELLTSGDIYHPLAWTAEETYNFLCQAEGFEHFGLAMRLPPWWRQGRRRRPVVEVNVGESEPTLLDTHALLDFDMRLSLDGEVLSEIEVANLLRTSAGLVLLRGQWVEADGARLAQVIGHWDGVRRRLERDGLTFAAAMRLLAGADLPAIEGTDGSAGTTADGDTDDDGPWSTVTAGTWLRGQLEALRSPNVSQFVERNAGLHAELRPYQKVGAQWLWSLYGLGLGGCLADDMGLGKTIQVIALLSLLEHNGVEPGVDLLVVPASLVANWSAELERFSPERKVLIAHGSRMAPADLEALGDTDLSGHDVVITTYGTVLRTDWMRSHPWRCVVLDEAQAIKNPAAKQTRAVKELQARWRLALTGTPVENRLGDLWSIFDFLNPGLLGGAKEFDILCRAMAKDRHRGFAPLRELIAPYVLRRLKTDSAIISDLPDKTEVTAHCLLTKEQAALYQEAIAALEEGLQSITGGMERRGTVLAFLTRFKQICNHPAQWLDDGKFTAARSGKFVRMAELTESIAGRQEKMLVFTQYRAMTEPLARHLATCFGQEGLVLHGGTPVKQRQGLVKRFQEDESVPFMVLSLKAGGTGLNLTAASHVVHFDRWWNPAVENQATDRAFRIGQHRNVLVHKLVCPGTIEERIDRLIAGKQDLAEEVLSDAAAASFTEMSDAELMALVRLDLATAVGA